MQSVLSGGAPNQSDPGIELFRVYFKIGKLTETTFEDTELRVDFPDGATGAHYELMIALRKFRLEENRRAINPWRFTKA